ncbi:prolyl-tRNA editing enzyme YbaK/EbsC (Cys-tRNA(Pro) deacylase) [Kribbella sp. VKM Ac-2527]|uniref:Prolyl-tRNA editing enzyme YbaK/EbsC (Cys-tRNA(Pro) deacylase) n=2 Tax=Kribbella caucasensis TaxID=2512215 RepID=A0A4R6K8E5_9ACTN|nr:YbaK/EbsC family protein [Kribbella sp. VKM Ac-2527]TDO45364.1 prolyl-tRNA editing enzyme YbaK/EbsC (Cys-tRNA(Pro) deacylase) [Kribbella sp. VKM Ac-2527]
MTVPPMGTLDWRPAAEVPELLAAPVRPALGDIPGYAAAIDPTLADTAAFCAEYDVPIAASANCVIVHGKRAGESTYAAVMVLATHRADVNGVIRKHLGVRKISFAAQDDAVGATGMEYGGITPIGLPADWPVLVDEAVAQAGLVVIGSGIRASKLLVEGSDLAKLPTATVLALANPV